jgi:putative membrane protein
MTSEMDHSNTADNLARERSREASDRTLMAWIRTSLALIGFGFGVGKASQYMETAFPDINLNPIKGTRLFGGAFMLLGAFCLIGAGIQHWQALRRLKRSEFRYVQTWPLTETVAVITLLIGLLAFWEFLMH